MNKGFEAVYHYIKGDYRVAEFGLTNICVAKCSFCKIWKQEPKVIVNTAEALKVLDKLASFGVRFITLTGGEAILHPDITEIVKRCTKLGIMSGILCADARLITVKRTGELKKAGLDCLAISVDHYTDEVEYEARHIKDMLGHIGLAVARLKEAGIRSVASTLVCSYSYDCLDKLFDKCNELGFDLIAVNYPETSLSPVYELGGDAVSLTKLQVADALGWALRLKKSGYRIANPSESVENILQYLRTGTAKYSCLGGNKVLFVDWFLDLYPCMHLAKPMGRVLEMSTSDLKKVECNGCGMSWYRDFSVYLQGARSIMPTARALGELVYGKQ